MKWTIPLRYWMWHPGGGVTEKRIKIRAFYHKKTRGGNNTKKIYQKLIPPEYCPFCGEKLIKTED